MKITRSILVLLIFDSFYLLTFSSLFAQLNKSSQDSLKYGAIGSVNSIQAEEGDVEFTDGTNSLLRITDEGSFGAIELKSGVPSTTTNKLYNDAGTLKFSGSSLSGSGATSINELSDAKYIGSSLFLGLQSGFVDDNSDNRNIGIGQKALLFNVTGAENVAIGYESMIANQTGNRNTAIGYLSLYSNEIGFGNTAIGNKALSLNLKGNYNTAVGYSALENNIGSTWVVDPIQGNYNVGIGYKALNSNTTGKYNTACGSVSLSSNTTADANTAFGYTALLKNIIGHGNTAFGTSALYNNGENATLATEGANNVAVGSQALFGNTLGSFNIGIGKYTNRYNQTGSFNTIIGYEAGSGVSTHNKSGNIFIGYQAGYYETSDDKLYIENSDAISPLIWGDFANDIAAVNGMLGVNTQNPTARVDIVGTSGEDPFRVAISGATKLKVHDNGGTSIGLNASGTPTNGLYVHGDLNYNAALTSVSDKRYKTNIENISNPLAKLKLINGVYYDWKRNEFPERNFSDKKQVGVIAQEVEQVFPELVVTNSEGYKSVDYSKLTAVLIEAVKSQSNKIEDLNRELIELRQIINKNVSKSENAKFSNKY